MKLKLLHRFETANDLQKPLQAAVESFEEKDFAVLLIHEKILILELSQKLLHSSYTLKCPVVI